MALPVAECYIPSHLYPESAFFHGKCRSMGGLPTQFCFIYWESWRPWKKYTPWQDVDHDGQDFDVNTSGLSWRGWTKVKACAKNASGVDETKPIMFWLPKPTAPKLGAPWLILRQGGSFRDMIYDWSSETDIGCLLHLLVGTRKPYVSPVTHVTRGVVFHHDAELWFRWLWKILSDQTVDTLLHDYHIPFFEYDRKYWFVALGTVDGQDSPSISPPYSFRMFHPPKMAIDDAYDITHNSAKLPGHLVDDYGMPAFVRFNYGKMPTYTDNTPTLGPFSSPAPYIQEITGLDPETWYRFRAEGSHDEGFPTHGISRPKDFLTLAPPTDTKECPLVNPGHWYNAGRYSWPASWIHSGEHGGMGTAPYSGYYTTGRHRIYRSAFLFDTSEIPPGATPVSAHLHVEDRYFPILGETYPWIDDYIDFVAVDVLADPPIAADYGHLRTQNTIIAQELITKSYGRAWRDHDLNAAGLANIVPGGTTYIGFKGHRDTINSQPPSSKHWGYVVYTTAPDPNTKLVVTYIPP